MLEGFVKIPVEVTGKSYRGLFKKTFVVLEAILSEGYKISLTDYNDSEIPHLSMHNLR